MKHKLLVLVALAAAVLSGCCGDCCKTGKNYKIKDGVIVFNEPNPAAGQQDMLQFAADPMDTVKVGFIGLGMRGPGAVSRFTHIDGTRTVALCDLEQDRVKRRYWRKPGSLKRRSISGKTAGNSFASVTTSISCISAPHGTSMWRWRFMPCSMENMLQWRCLRLLLSRNAGSWSMCRSRHASIA